ncbi:MAG: winged helix-turn-helix transcriptional regulator [Haloferacaceae archaeon]
MTGNADVPEEECLAVWCAGDEWCAITCTMDLIGKKWHPVIVDRLLTNGPLRFSELSDEVGPITNKVLSNSLKDLQGKDLVERTVVNDQPVEVEYALTERGRSLESVIESLKEWGRSHLRPADSRDESVC